MVEDGKKNSEENFPRRGSNQHPVGRGNAKDVRVLVGISGIDLMAH